MNEIPCTVGAQGGAPPYERGIPVGVTCEKSIPCCPTQLVRTIQWLHGPRQNVEAIAYRGTSLIRKRPPLGPYSRHMSRALGWS